MKSLFWIVLLVVITGCGGEYTTTPANPGELTEFEKSYLPDCRELYVREILADTTHANYHNPELDPDALQKLLDAFRLVYNLDVPERDTVFTVYNIHALRCHSLSSILLEVDPEAPEIQKMVNGLIPTDYAPLDQLLVPYGFDSVRVSYHYPDFPWLSLRTKGYYNLVPLIHAFEKLPYVLVAEENGGCFDGNNITLQRDNGQIFLTFSIGRGDCPAGCIYRRYWKFRVGENQAWFAGSWEN